MKNLKVLFRFYNCKGDSCKPEGSTKPDVENKTKQENIPFSIKVDSVYVLLWHFGIIADRAT